LEPAPDQPQRVLIVEDDPALREITQILLQDCPQQLRFAASGREALETAVEFSPDMVLLDLGLPDMHGFEVAQELRRLPIATSMRLVALTGFDSQQHRQQAEQIGIDEFIQKPMDLETMESMFARLFCYPVLG
jgi:CheY-like chemotaxis protein